MSHLIKSYGGLRLSNISLALTISTIVLDSFAFSLKDELAINGRSKKLTVLFFGLEIALLIHLNLLLKDFW